MSKNSSNKPLKTLKCSECDYKTEKAYRLKRHLTKHSNCRLFKCPHCDDSFKTADTLKMHMNMHTGDKPYQCIICSQHFHSSSRLYYHMRLFHKPKYECSQCQKTFVEKSKLKRHEKDVHNVEIEVQPGMLDTYDEELTVTKEKEEQIKSHQCNFPLCDTSFTTLGRLNRHILYRHKLEGRHQCSKCNETFVELNKMKLHMKNDHCDEEVIILPDEPHFETEEPPALTVERIEQDHDTTQCEIIKEIPQLSSIEYEDADKIHIEEPIEDGMMLKIMHVTKSYLVKVPKKLI